MRVVLNLQNYVSNVTIANEDEQIKAHKKLQESLNELEKGNEVEYFEFKLIGNVKQFHIRDRNVRRNHLIRFGKWHWRVRT